MTLSEVFYVVPCAPLGYYKGAHGGSGDWERMDARLGTLTIHYDNGAQDVYEGVTSTAASSIGLSLVPCIIVTASGTYEINVSKVSEVEFVPYPGPEAS